MDSKAVRLCFVFICPVAVLFILILLLTSFRVSAKEGQGGATLLGVSEPVWQPAIRIPQAPRAPDAAAIAISKSPDAQLVRSGELVTFTIAVTNTGDSALSNVTVLDPAASGCEAMLGSLAPEQALTYQCSVTATADFTNTATVTATDPLSSPIQASDIAFVDVTPSVYIYDDVPASPITIRLANNCLDGAIQRTFSVAEDFVIGDVRLGFNANHAARGDIWGSLLSPAGTLVQLFDDSIHADMNDNYDILFSDESLNPIDDGDNDDTAEPYFDRLVRPFRPLSAFQGENAQGTWILEFCDKYPITNHGSYNRSRLIFEDALLTIDQTASALKILPGEAITYTITIANPGVSTLTGVALSDPLSSDLSYRADSLSATTGTALASTGMITWTGELAAQSVATITFAADVVNPEAVLITNTAIVSHTLLSGELAATEVSQIFRAQDYLYTNETDIVIPDGDSSGECISPIASTIFVPDDFLIGDVRVGVSIEHTFRGDLEIYLENPVGTSIGLLLNTGYEVNLDALFSDAGPEEAYSEVAHDTSAPYYDVSGQTQGTGSAPLSTFDGTSSGGTWTLHVCDNAYRDLGKLLQWSLFFDEANLWLGYNSSWNTASNWSLGSIPDSSELALVRFPYAGEYSPVLDAPAAVGNLLVDGGSTVDLSSYSLTAEEYVNNRGTLSQTLPVTTTGVGVELLHLTDSAGTADRYLGVVITPTVGNLGDVTVGIRGNQTGGCTAVQSDSLLTRCFQILPSQITTATIQYYFTENERNNQDAAALKVFDRGSPPTHWLQLGTGYEYSESGATCTTSDGLACWLRATGIASYPRYVLGSATPPSISLEQLGSDLRLSWSHAESNVDHYEVWRAPNRPYFTPGDTDATMIASLSPSAGSQYVYTDTSSTIGDSSTNQFYVIRTIYLSSLQTTDANRVGEFDYDLLPGAYNTVVLSLADGRLLTADDLGAATGAIVVSRWRASTQSLDSRIVGGAGVNFPLMVGEPYFIDLPSGGASLFSVVGGVSVPGSIRFTIQRGGSCLLNLVSLPFDSNQISTADELAAAIGGVPVISQWRPDTGSFDSRIVGQIGNDFVTLLGYPYWPCADNSMPDTIWP